jgi:predicted ATPase
LLDFGAAAPRIAEIVLTGGSCAGKTTAVGLLSRSLREQGHSVLTVPEAVTMLVTAGIPNIGDISRNDLHRGCLFQRQVFTVQRTLRATHRELALLFDTESVVILYDRGEMDGYAYHQHDCLEQFAAAEGTTLAEIRDSYAAVMHLVTAADGAEAAYALTGNPARWDTAEEACRFDRQILRAWDGHPRRVVIDNSTDFIGKMDRLVQATLRVLETLADSASQGDLFSDNVVPLRPAQ